MLRLPALLSLEGLVLRIYHKFYLKSLLDNFLLVTHPFDLKVCISYTTGMNEPWLRKYQLKNIETFQNLISEGVFEQNVQYPLKPFLSHPFPIYNDKQPI